MSDTHATTTVSVSATCEDGKCNQPAEVSTIVTGEYGRDGIAAYCEDCAAKRDESANHTHIGTIEKTGVPSQKD